ncbi:long-chain acyl-CoA synthetase [Pseudonocardia ammonioxydans]|uniref:Long-chain acyl-CoA synthetase n=1 Tax=Pseudonocardia ammonioxydans TaxID=260086 RepID=A0A1I5BVQ3_PSUAM|nr:AMP-binding protein [Pseudonocardia ammonioxydans]SFN78783.1 long-chain acyl-CoA synthetase [Pseudonocardia ammonioxydans]
MVNIGRIPAKWAALTPRADAVVDATNGRRTDWRTLDERVRRLANGLAGTGDGGLGLAQGDRVAILSRNSTEYQELYYAAGRAGLVAQPLNWRLGTAELSRIVADAAPSALIVSDEWSETADALQSEVDVKNRLSYGDASDGSLEDLIARSSDDEPERSAHVGDADPFFILYTGGTTGESKGALHSHTSTSFGMLNQTVAERIVPTDVYMLTGQMYHIPVVLSMNYMRHGCPLVLMNFSARTALELIEAERVSAFLGITTMLNWMMAEPGFGNFDISSLRNIQYGGGPMPSSVVKAALDHFPCTLIQGYGQTEGTTMCFLSQEDHADAVRGIHPERLMSCGREGFVTNIRIVDPDGNEVPRDGRTAGEIVVRSEANMLGYLNRPDLTAATLRDGWMWTGDVATWDADSYVFIVDRAKDMIISGGENIYSIQVEEAVNQHPAVLECAVIGVPDDEWGEAVKAFVVLKPDTTATADDIVGTAKQHLASYQKPRSVEFVDSLPKAPTGKILKRALRDGYWADRERSV